MTSIIGDPDMHQEAVSVEPSATLKTVSGSNRLRMIAQSITEPLEQANKWSVPPELQGNQLTQHQIEKFKAFEELVVHPVALRLREMDPNSEILISGSYKNNPDGVRLWSDVDVIVLSRVLKDPEKYIEFLAALQARALDYHLNYREGSDWYQPVFFTRATTENFFQHLAAHMVMEKLDAARAGTGVQQVGRCVEPDYNDYAKVLPCHFLYYADAQEMLDREPEYLGRRLLTSSKPVLETNSDRVFCHKRDQQNPVLQSTL